MKALSFIRKHDRRTILTTFARKLSQEEIEANKLMTYVRQLEIINCDDDDKMRAVTDFLRASFDRTQWGIKGWVNDSSFEEFEQGLTRTWKNLKRQTEIELSGRTSIERGMSLYTKCSLHRANLEGLEVPDHFTPGSFHALADKEDVWWHPDYLNLKSSGMLGK